MMVSNSWKVRNKLYQLKEREKGLEKCVEDTKDDYTFLKEFKLFKRPKNAVSYKWYASVCLFAILGLDKIIYYHYMRYKAYKEIIKVRKLLIQTRKEIKYYEQC